MVSNRHVYQLVASIVTSVLNCGLCSLWAAFKENVMEGREQVGEGLVILESTQKYQFLTLYDWIWLSVSAHVWECRHNILCVHDCEKVGLIKPATPLNWKEQIRHILYFSSILSDRYIVQWGGSRKYLMSYRRPGFLAVIRFGSFPLPAAPLSRQ